MQNIPKTTEYLYKDLTDLPVTGKMKDENDNDVIIRTGFIDIIEQGKTLLVLGKINVKYRILQYSVMSNNNIEYYFVSGNNTKLCSTKQFSFVADSPIGTYLFETNFNENLSIELSSEDNSPVVSVDIIFGEIKNVI